MASNLEPMAFNLEVMVCNLISASASRKPVSYPTSIRRSELVASCYIILLAAYHPLGFKKIEPRHPTVYEHPPPEKEGWKHVARNWAHGVSHLADHRSALPPQLPASLKKICTSRVAIQRMERGLLGGRVNLHVKSCT